MKIFLSHSSRDTAIVREVRSFLPRSISTWLDDDNLVITPHLAVSLKETIQADTDFVVIFLGREAIKSEWISRELQWALEREKELGRVFILPILLDDMWDEIKPERFRNRFYLKCFEQSRNSVISLAKELTDHLFKWLDNYYELKKRSETEETKRKKDRLAREKLLIPPKGTICEKGTAPDRILSAKVNWAELNPREFTHSACNICGIPHSETLASIVINWAEFFLVKCTMCDLIWRNPLPGHTFLRELYSEKYFNVEEHSPEISDQVGIADTNPIDQERRNRISRMVVQTWINNFHVTPKDSSGRSNRFLEIGGGRGYLQRIASEMGWETMGLEISPHGIKEAISRKSLVLPVLLDELCTRYIPYESYFDLVVFYDFLEHVEDPSRVLRLIHYILADDGNIIFRVPNTTFCPTLHLIDHIWHFSSRTLPILLYKEGFKVWKAHESGKRRSSKVEDNIKNITIYARKRKDKDVLPIKELEIDENPMGNLIW